MDYIYDLECYPNVFTFAVTNGKDMIVLEISERKNDLRTIKNFLTRCHNQGHRLVGYNNLSYDWPVLDVLVKMPVKTQTSSALRMLKEKSNKIIDTPWHDRFRHVIWDKDQYVQQIDLVKIHHFDNAARLTSLKELEFNMQMESIEELPFDPDKDVPVDQFDKLVEYNKYDVKATHLFYEESLDMIKLREELGEVYDCNMLNYSDAKIGTKILETKLGWDSCYIYENGQRYIRQTKRPKIDLGDCVFDYVEFESEAFQKIHEHFLTTTITETKGVFDGLSAEFGGIPYHFGTGGLHGCCEARVWDADETHDIVDIDVTSYYPSLAIENQVYPQHLGVQFCSIYNSIKQERLKYPKGSPRNLALKLALNAAYGNSNNKYSFLFDSKFTMKITINGQLLLCMLIEQVMKIEGLEFIQANTDGITVYCHKDQRDKLSQIMKDWETLTNLTLETVEFKRMVVRDVNNFLAIYA